MEELEIGTLLLLLFATLLIGIGVGMLIKSFTLYSDAWDKGFNRGYDEGYKDGQADAQKEMRHFDAKV